MKNIGSRIRIRCYESLHSLIKKIDNTVKEKVKYKVTDDVEVEINSQIWEKLLDGSFHGIANDSYTLNHKVKIDND
jgi:hypothetical protein